LADLLGDEIIRARRQNRTLGFALAGIENLAGINEAYGFDVADEVIAAIAQRLRRVMRRGDRLARYAGNRFGLVLDGCAEEQLPVAAQRFAEAVCAEVHTTIKERTRDDGTTFPVTADDTSTVLLRFADGVVGSTSCTVMGLGIDRRLTELFGSEGAIEIDTTLLKGDSGRLGITTARPGEDRRQIAPSRRDVRSGIEIPSRRAGGAIRAMALMLEDWLPAFNGEPTPGVPTLYDGLVTASVIEAAQRSADGEGWVRLDL